jgi:UrcA family protein
MHVMSLRHATGPAATALVIALCAAPLPAMPPDITAYAPSHSRVVIGPDTQGRYTLRVRIADLDPATADGWQQMTRRVAMGTSDLCDAAGAAPRFPSYFAAEQRACRAETQGQAQPQMEQARNLARGGQRVAFLDLSR